MVNDENTLSIGDELWQTNNRDRLHRLVRAYLYAKDEQEKEKLILDFIADPKNAHMVASGLAWRITGYPSLQGARDTVSAFLSALETRGPDGLFDIIFAACEDGLTMGPSLKDTKNGPAAVLPAHNGIWGIACAATPEEQKYLENHFPKFKWRIPGDEPLPADVDSEDPVRVELLFDLGGYDSWANKIDMDEFFRKVGETYGWEYPDAGAGKVPFKDKGDGWISFDVRYRSLSGVVSGSNSLTCISESKP